MIIKCLVLLFSGLFLDDHGGHTAEYYFSVQEDRLHMNFIIDQHELTHYTLDKDCKAELMLAFCTAKYVLKHSSIYVDGKEVPLEFAASRIEKEHLVILFEGTVSKQPIEEIKIKNDCFLEFESDFKNRVTVDIGRFRSTYRLDKGRKEVLVRYRRVQVLDQRAFKISFLSW